MHIIYTDASVVGRGKRMRGGLAYTIDGKKFSEYHISIDINHLELVAVLKAISKVTPSVEEIHVYCDSAYVVKNINEKTYETWEKNDWRTLDGSLLVNVSQWRQIVSILRKNQITFHKVKAHSGDAENAECDTMAKKAAYR